AINPGAMDAHNNLANIYAEQDKNELAIEQYKKAIQVDPNNFSTYFNLGLALAATGRDKKALEAFLQAAQLNPTYTPVHSALARLYLKTQNWAGALAHFTVLSELEPQVLGHWMQIARVYLQMGEPRLALSSLQETQRQFPTRLSVNELMAEAHFRLKEMDAAATQLEYLIERAPQASQQAYIQLGWIRYLQTRVDEAVQWTKKSLDLAKNPQLTVLGQMNLGLYHLVQGKFEEGETWYKKALAAPNEKILPALVQDLEEARQRYPDNQELIFYQGWAYAQAGKPKLAAPPLKRYLADNPQGVRAAKARQLLGRTGTAEKPRASVEGMVLVTKGFFVMGSNQHAKDEAPEHRVFLEAYYIDLTEVTAAEFAGFLNTLPGPAMSARYFNRGKRATVGFDEKRFFARPGLEDLPANKVTWYGADAYCRWRDKRLPTEAEWEKAARGIDGRIYPWGDEPPTPERARFLQKWTDETEHRVMLPVRTLPQSRSPFGLFHMAGNLKEWVDDWYDREYYKEEQHKVNPKGQVGGEYKVLKGGSWRDLKSFLYSSFRNNSYPRSGLDDYGFRCAKSEDGAPAPGRLTGRHVPVPVASLQPQQLTIDDWRH
ncbi:MAG: SUMF1/EgtB/PvdO family nonheme iron enzyme, partial [Nitrospinaceae bacterium]